MTPTILPTSESLAGDDAPRQPGVPAYLIETPLDRPGPAAGVDWADRRLADRLPPLPSARAEAYRPGGRGGADFADGLLDVSAGGIRVRVCQSVRPGERFDVNLWGPDGAWCARGLAVVRWVEAVGPGEVQAGLQFARPLADRLVRQLADGHPPVPARLTRC